MHLNRQAFLAAAALAVVAVLPSACTSTTTSATAPSSSKCQVGAAASPLQFPAAGGSGQLTITAERDCTWAVTSPAEWLSLGGERTGNGSATVPFTVTGNQAPVVRGADLVVDDVRLGVTQAAAPCTYSLNRSSDSVDATGGTRSVNITTLTGCNWTATSTTSWLSLSRSTGQSSGSVQVTAEANSGDARTGVVMLGGQAYTLAQAAAPTTTPPPTVPPTPPPTPPPTSPPPPPPPPPPPDPPPPGPITLSGTVSAISGSCPSVRFTVSGRNVATDRDTDFSRGSRCRDLSNGDTVQVSGLVQSSGVVLATDLEITRNER